MSTPRVITVTLRCLPNSAIVPAATARCDLTTWPMHFATFAGSALEAVEPIVELTAAREFDSVGDWGDEGGFGWIDIGQTAVIELEDAQAV